MRRPYIKLDICTHPEGIKPICKCGANAACPICGFGRGAHPCACTKDRIDRTIIKETAQKYSKMFAGAWTQLAK